MAEWFCVVNQQRVGPLSEPQVRAMLAGGQKVLLWRQGMTQWTAAEAVPEFSTETVSLAQAVPDEGQSQVLSYQVQSEVAYSQAVADDPGPFAKISSQLALDKDRWTGVCFATPQAFYLIKKSRMGSQTGFVIGGLAGMLIAAAAQSDQQTRTCQVSELPPGTRAAVDPKGKLGKYDVVVLPREAITLVKMSQFGGVKIQTGAEQYSAVVGMFSYSRVKRRLVEMGWQLGVEMTPTIDAPVRKGLRPGTKPKALWLKVLYIVLGIIILVAVVVLRAMMK